MSEFGEAPAYASAPLLGAAVLGVLGGLGQAIISIFDMSGSLLPGVFEVAACFLAFLFCLMLVIRHIEARDAMGDPLPRVRQYDTGHERAAYLAGLITSLLVAAVGVPWRGGAGAWHLLPGSLALLAAALFWRLWRGRLN